MRKKTRNYFLSHCGSEGIEALIGKAVWKEFLPGKYLEFLKKGQKVRRRDKKRERRGERVREKNLGEILKFGCKEVPKKSTNKCGHVIPSVPSCG